MLRWIEMIHAFIIQRLPLDDHHSIQRINLSMLRSFQLLRILFRKSLLRCPIRLDLLPRKLLAKLTPSANLIAILQKEEWNNAQHQTDETKQTASPRNPQTLVHWSSSKGNTTANRLREQEAAAVALAEKIS